MSINSVNSSREKPLNPPVDRTQTGMGKEGGSEGDPREQDLPEPPLDPLPPVHPEVLRDFYRPIPPGGKPEKHRARIASRYAFVVALTRGNE